jgi:cyclomaltodextrinase
LREFDIDGWRLDVPEEVHTPGFWEEFRTRVKAIKPDAYIVGEIWHAAPEWLLGDRFDAVMNYLFAAAVIAFVAGERVSPALVEGREYEPYPPTDAAQFGRRIDQLLGLYHWETSQALLNLLDSHDTARLISLSRGDTSAVHLATLFQMTYPGAPCVYYGDEIGLRGSESYDEPFRDCEARHAFPWHDRKQWDESLLDYFKQAITLRHAHPVLRHGRFEQLYEERMCFAFARRTQEKGLIVALNAGEQEAELSIPVSHFLDDGVELRQLFGAGLTTPVRDGRLALTLPARSGMVAG